MSTDDASGSARVRKRHTKSRGGCRTCKKRRVKCDENKPECRKCADFGVPCDYLPYEDWQRRASELDVDSWPGATSAKRRGRPRADWCNYSAEIRNTLKDNRRGNQDTSPSSQGTRFEDANPLLQPLNAEQLLLFHHYLTSTAHTIGHPHIWRDSVPLLAKDYPSILHAMLSLAAFHIHRTEKSDRSDTFLTTAEHHYEMVVRDATSAINTMNRENCQTIYALTSFISIITFAKGPTPGDLVLVAAEGRVPCLYLMRGVRMVLENFDSSVILSGIFDPKPRYESRAQGCNCPLPEMARDEVRYNRFAQTHPGWDWELSLTKLSNAFLTDLEPSLAGTLQKTATSIRKCFEELSQKSNDRENPEDSDFVCVFRWAYCLDNDFIDTLEQRQKFALILLGFFAVLLGNLPGFWWLEGWGTHLLKEVKQELGPPEYHKWLP